MRDAWGDKHSGGITWREVHAWAKDIEREHRCNVVWHIWPDISMGKVWRLAVRVEAVAMGSGYKGRPLAHWYELWPNGRQPTLVAAIYRGLLELQSLLEQKSGAR